VSEAANPEEDLSAHLARGSRVQKIPFKTGSTFDEGKAAQYRVTFSEERSQVGCYAKETDFEHLLTGDVHGFIMSTPIIRLGLHRGSLFRLKEHRKFRPMLPGFHDFIDVRHPQSSCFTRRDAVQWGVL
jgi:hypothetical protein